MEEIVVLVLQFFFEFFLQLVGSGMLDGLSRLSNGKNDGCFAFLLHTFVGGGLGFLSTLVSPHLFLPFLWLRLMNLVLSPLLAGGLSYWFATLRNKTGQDANAHFLHGFLFALMFGLARFAFATR